MANEHNLRPPWKPGETGNPAGSSRKARTRALLRDFFHEELLDELTEEERRALGSIVEGLVVGQAAARLVRRDMLLGTSRERAKAIDQILGTEPKLVEISGDLDLTESDLEGLAAEIIQGNQRRGNGKARGNGSDPAGRDQEGGG